MPALNPSTPAREAVRAALVAGAVFLAGSLWVVADAAAPVPVGPLAALLLPEASIAPRAWAESQTWHGWANLAFAVQASGFAWALRLAALALGAAAVLAIVHPGAYQRPARYYLAPLRRVTAYLSAVAVAYGVPGAVAALHDALVPDLSATTTTDLGAAVRLGAVMALVGAAIWTVAGPGVWNVRALLRFSHGALAGIAVWATCALAVLLAAPLRDLGELVSIGNVMMAVDASHGAPGATFGTVLVATLLVYASSLALAGALVAVGAPQSMGAWARSGAAWVAAVLFVGVLGLGWGTARTARSLVAEASPDVVAALGLDTVAAPRPVVLLLGERDSTRRVLPRQALLPLKLAQDCAPATVAGSARLPAASEANLARLDAWLAEHRTEVSALAARVVGCRVSILARLFRPSEARAQIFTDPVPLRVGSFALSFGLRGLGEGPVTSEGRTFLAEVEDTTRWALSDRGKQQLARWRARAAASATGAVTGRLAVRDPSRWRVGLAAGVDPASGADPLLVAPRSDGLVLLAMAQATSPDERGGFAFPDVAPGWYQLALLAPEGTEPAVLATLSIQGDPGQFQQVAGRSRRDLGTIRLTY